MENIFTELYKLVQLMITLTTLLITSLPKVINSKVIKVIKSNVIKSKVLKPRHIEPKKTQPDYIRDMFNEEMDIAVKKYNLPSLRDYQLKYEKNILITRLGRTYHTQKIISLSKPTFEKLNTSKDEIRSIIKHEIAHAICFITKCGKKHDTGWKKVCLDLGGTGLRCTEVCTQTIRKERQLQKSLKNGN